MTHLLKILISLTLLMLYGHSQAQTTEKAKNPLENIQEKVHIAFATAIKENNKEPLDKLDFKLEKLYEEKKHNIIKYWHAYAKYYTAIYFLTKNNKDLSEKEIDKAVEWLKELKNKTSEDYALLSLTQGFAIQFKNMIKMISLSQQLSKNGELAIKKDSTNLRGYYALASSDFYRPEKFGGGKQVEKLLLKAIKLQPQKIKNNYLPSWGQKEAYEMLVKWYIRKENWQAAKKHYQEAIEKFPQSYLLKELSTILKNKQL